MFETPSPGFLFEEEGLELQKPLTGLLISI